MNPAVRDAMDSVLIPALRELREDIQVTNKSVQELREEFEAIATAAKQTRDRVDSVQAAAREDRRTDPILMFLGQTVLVCQSYNGRYRSLSL